MSTLLKIFFLPRIKTLLWQMLLVNVICFSALYLGNFQIAALCLIGFMYIVTYNLMNVNFSDNLEWMRNSVYSPKKLLKYYFFEQTLMLFATSFCMVFSIFGIGFIFILLKPSTKIATETLKNNDMVTMLGPLYEKAQHFMDASPTENALELVFLFVIIFSFMFGGQIVKTYFLNLRFEKKFSKEARFFQFLMIGIMFFMVTMDKFDIIFQFKIILMPLILAVDLFAIIFATNQTYKLFRQEKKSPIFYIPAGVFAVVFTAGLGFSLLSFNISQNVNKKIAEHRFLGVFAPKLDKDFVLLSYKSTLTDSALNYLMANYPLSSEKKHFYNIVNRKGLEQKILLTKMWKLEDLSETQRDFVLKSINQEFLSLESKKNKDRIVSLFQEINTKFLEKNPNYQNYAITKVEKEETSVTRLPASEL